MREASTFEDAEMNVVRLGETLDGILVLDQILYRGPDFGDVSDFSITCGVPPKPHLSNIESGTKGVDIIRQHHATLSTDPSE